jgi:glucose-6-phosphate 1-dehydrogenase
MSAASDEFDGRTPPAAPADPCAMVIFGANGDLTKRKLMPALLNLKRGQLLPEAFTIVAVARTEVSEAEFCAKLLDDLGSFAQPPLDAAEREWLGARLRYVRGAFQDPALYDRLEDVLASLAPATRGNVLFYMAAPPDFFDDIGLGIGHVGLAREEGGAWRRIIVEKPFGHDLTTAKQLNRQMAGVFREHQIYRIDHYLGKETVQNLMVLRFDLRAGVEPPLHRPRADHGGGDRGRRGPGRLLRHGRRAARHGAEPPVPAARPHRHGAAELVRRRSRP